ncbi:MAG: tetratricopeptide repeat protein [Neisseriaceae bacterium]|nr:tetratricopeptide repeat protein [Neisseriaceae bacterium]
MKKFLFLLLLLSNTIVFSQPYQEYNHQQALINENGKYQINIAVMFKAVDNLYKHAQEYPLKFDNKQDANNAYRDLQILIKTFDYIKQEKIIGKFSSQDKFNFELGHARLFLMAHNFDMPNMMKKADEHYQKLIKNNPNNGKLYAEYGGFLSNSMRIKQGEEYLQKAIQLGEKQSYLQLGMNYLIQDKKQLAIETLEQYQKYYPKNTETAKIIQAIKSGNIQKNSK